MRGAVEGAERAAARFREIVNSERTPAWIGRAACVTPQFVYRKFREFRFGPVILCSSCGSCDFSRFLSRIFAFPVSGFAKRCGICVFCAALRRINPLLKLCLEFLVVDYFDRNFRIGSISCFRIVAVIALDTPRKPAMKRFFLSCHLLSPPNLLITTLFSWSSPHGARRPSLSISPSLAPAMLCSSALSRISQLNLPASSHALLFLDIFICVHNFTPRCMRHIHILINFK